MYLFQRIEEVKMHYDDARHTVADFVLREQKDLYKYTINDIAEATFTSNATVTRFAKTLGFHGWKDFIQEFVSELKYQERHKGTVDVNVPFSADDSPENIIEKMKKVQIDAIEDTVEQMDINMLNRGVNYITKANRIMLFAASPNVYLAELFRRKLMTIGKHAEIAQMGEMGSAAYSLTSRDCAVIISYAGNNPTIPYLRCIQPLKEQKVPIIGVTSGGNNYLRQNADCVLTISSRERLYSKISNFATEESINYILNTLFSCTFARNYQKNYDYKINNARVLEQGRTTVLRELQE